MKTYVITLSQKFQHKHSKAGEPTEFKDKFFEALRGEGGKIHTIRANYDLWKHRFDEIDAGLAQLSIRQWSGLPYRSKQIELALLSRKDGIGIQRLKFDKSGFLPNVDYKPIGIGYLANNDGLTFDDWSEWFKDYDKTKPLAIIHFTAFRY